MRAEQLLDGEFLPCEYHTSTGEYFGGKDEKKVADLTRQLRADGAIVSFDNEHTTVRFWRKHPPMIGEAI